MKFIPVSNSTKVIIVDDEDFNRIKLYNWWIQDTCIRASVNGTKITLGRFIMGNPPNGYDQVDHIDRDIFNNQKSNLRFCTNSQNASNRIRRTGKSGYKGVYWHVKTSKWQAVIRVNKLNYNLGFFINKEEAAEAYNLAAIKHFGEFAVLNEIENKNV